MEFLALTYAVIKKFHDYLYGHTFTVLTDNNPLVYVLTIAKLDATGHRLLCRRMIFVLNVNQVKVTLMLMCYPPED